MVLKQGLGQKLGSQQGASIIIALFLFLICAALAAVILAAGTAAAGRISGLAVADQKYYNTTSAASLFRELMANDAVQVEIACTRTTETTRLPGGGTSVSEGAVACTIDGQDIGDVDTGSALTQQIAKAMLSQSGDDYWNWQFGSSAIDASASTTLRLSHEVSGLSPDAKALVDEGVQIEQAIDEAGSFVFTFKGTSPSARDTRDTANKPYTLKLTCPATAETKTSTQTYTTTGKVKRVDTKVTTIAWKPSKIEQVGDSSEGGA